MEALANFLKRREVRYIRNIRAIFMRKLRSRRRYLASYSTRPISIKYGFDRGTPVDRFYIESFLEDHKDQIHGVCLEVVDDTYIRKFGAEKVTQSDAVDIFKTKKANIHADLRDLKDDIGDEVYDTIILTQTLHVIDDYESVIRECRRILKTGGSLIVTLPTVSPAWNLKINHWRFSPDSARYIFTKYFEQSKVKITHYGNRKSSEFFWLGMATQDMTKDELAYDDPSAPTIVGVIAIK